MIKDTKARDDVHWVCTSGLSCAEKYPSNCKELIDTIKKEVTCEVAKTAKKAEETASSLLPVLGVLVLLCGFGGLAYFLVMAYLDDKKKKQQQQQPGEDGQENDDQQTRMAQDDQY